MEKLISCERENRFFDLTIKNLPFYFGIRTHLVHELSKQLELWDLDSYSVNRHNFNSRKKIKNLLSHLFFSNPVSLKKNRDCLIFQHPRMVDFQNQQIDIYSYFLAEKIPSKIIFQWPNLYSDSLLPLALSHDIHQYDFYAIWRRISDKFLINYFSEAKNLASEMNKILNQKFDHEFQLVQFIYNKIIHFVSEYKIAKFLYKKIKPKIILDVISYGHPGLVFAAKDYSIPVVELQHGIISHLHPGYHLPDQEKNMLKSFPDYICFFGEYWKESACFPLTQDRLRVVGHPYFQISKEKYKNKNPINKKNKIIIISQKTVGKNLVALALELSEKLPDEKFILKLHPKQKNSWREEFPELLREKKTNLEIYTSEKPLYDLFSESKIQMGVFSSALYEGMEFGLKTILMNFPGVEFMENLIQKKMCSLALNTEDAIQKIKSLSQDENIFALDQKVFTSFNSQAIEDLIKLQ